MPSPSIYCQVRAFADRNNEEQRITNSFAFVGNIRRFRRLCEHIQKQLFTRRPPPSPRAQRKFTTELSESSSCGSDSSELHLNSRQVSI